VNDISRNQVIGYKGVGAERTFVHDRAAVRCAAAQSMSSALVLPSNGATDVPIMQLKLSSQLLQNVKLNYLGVGSKRRVVMSDAASVGPPARELFSTGWSLSVTTTIVSLRTGGVLSRTALFGPQKGEMKCG